jgi:type VI secretion system ImpM family protein
MANRYLPVGCFGKLPIWPEYMEAGTSYPAARALKQWLHGGREHAGMEDPNGGRADTSVRAHLRLLIGTPGSTELLVGVLRPSGDQGGRSFPFSVFSFIPRKLYGKQYQLLPLALSPIWDVLEDAWDSLAGVATKNAFEEMLETLDVPHPAQLNEVKGVYQGRQRESTEPMLTRDDGASLGRTLNNLPGLLNRLRKGSDAEGLLVELPVSREPDGACFDASVWIDLVNRQFLLKRYEPLVFLDAGREAADRRLLLKFGALLPSDYAAIMALRDAGAAVARPAHPHPDEGTEPGSDTPPTTYADLLGRKLSARG